MIANSIISSYCRISNHKVELNGTIIYQDDESLTFNAFAKAVYKEKLAKYSKFFKMDGLSKLAHLSTDLLLLESDFSTIYEAERIAVVLGNTSATLSTDVEYFNTVKDPDNYFPSPGHFVYTLPNIMIGEICIKHKIKGENLCLITEEKELEPIINYVNLLFETDCCDACIAGYIDFTGESYEAITFLMERKEQTTSSNNYTLQQIKNLLTKKEVF